jgi:alpha-glucosidase
MQWTPGPEAGFTTSTHPWLPIPPSYLQYNVQTESQDADSIFTAYQKLLSLRKTDPALREGSYESIDNDNPYVFSFLRKSGNHVVLVSLNMSANPQTISLHEAHVMQFIPLYSSPSMGDGPHSLENLHLAPFGVLVASLE